MCLVFDTVPSELNTIYWRNTLKDIRVRLRLHMGQQQALIIQNFQTLATIVSQAFGAKKEKKAVEPQTQAELEASFRSVFG